ncbi:hypothetical protein AGLY_005280 [Aphis glycines]|uniref:Peroxiredoxin-5 n=2 Tax=Aphis TaxID=464929 RepID=A0A6G0TWA9_APHGL|nr:peroxiredoxin-5, mitochondrial isoform X1 [Aphis gossypii]KAE9540028.1 hypothetical protein AGLY_005280 [Aphis glycines]
MFSSIGALQKTVSAVPTSVLSTITKRLLSISQNSKMPVKVGDTVPSVDLFENTPANKVNISELCNGKTVILFAVPGAFTPGCSKTHLPGYVNTAEDLKSKGVDEIVCVSVNDAFVMAAWAQDQKAEGKVRLLADPNAELTKAFDLAIDLPPLGGTRSKRYSMLIKNGKVEQLNVEPDNTGLSCSLANKIVL